MSKSILIFAVLVFNSWTDVEAHQLVVWNVGQGQWVSEITDELCIHYDIGGEYNLISQVLRKCLKKKNFILLSHWDWDHINWAPKFAVKLPQVCLLERPTGKPKANKEKHLASIRLCSENEKILLLKYVRKIHSPDARLKQSNDLSSVFESRLSKTLIPGDSSARQEHQWKKNISPSSQILILGHHGSKTSSSNGLLQYLPNLRIAIASARQKRYGHPHSLVTNRLKRKKIPLLRTEDWGHLIIEYSLALTPKVP